ncbi:hypothetical protein FVP00_23500 [Vibrio parahaemolyticus]|nr:hypothetical protein FVP00_23500 [Vibrio parahaemolyticus]
MQLDSVLWILGTSPQRHKLTPAHRQKTVKKNGKTGEKIHLMNPHCPAIKLHSSPPPYPLN